MSSSLSHFSITKPQQQKDEVTQKATSQKRSQDPARALGSSIADVAKWALSTSIKGQFGETEMGRHRHVWPREETPQGSESADASGASCGRVQEACVCCPCANCMPRPMLCQHLHLGWLFCFYYPSLTPPQTQQKSPKSLRGKGAHSPWCRAPLPPALDSGTSFAPISSLTEPAVHLRGRSAVHGAFLSDRGRLLSPGPGTLFPSVLTGSAPSHPSGVS